jgi:hypothetical protein
MNRKDRKEVGQALNKSLLVNDIRQMIEETRLAVATAVNAVSANASRKKSSEGRGRNADRRLSFHLEEN